MNMQKEFELRNLVLTKNPAENFENLEFSAINLYEVEEAIQNLEELKIVLKRSHDDLRDRLEMREN